MNRTLRSVCLILSLTVGLWAAADMAYPQSGIESSKELQDSPASQELLKDDGKILEKRNDGGPIELDSGQEQTASQPLPAAPPNPYEFQDGALKLLNCSGRAVTVKTYNSNDAVLWVPYQTNAIANGQALGLKCATRNCKLIIGSLRTSPLSGYRVYINSVIKPTNKAAADKGCDAYN